MDIHQVSVNYQQEQDRILVRINTRQDEEIRLWLTRRLCVGWVPALRDVLDRMDLASAQAGASAATQPEAAQATAPEPATDGLVPDFKTPFKANAQTLPLGSKPLLVTTVRMSLRPPDKLDIAFEESLSGQSAQARGFQASLEQQLAQGILHLLEQALEHSDWDLPIASTHGRDDATGAAPGDEFSSGPTGHKRSKYLH